MTSLEEIIFVFLPVDTGRRSAELELPQALPSDPEEKSLP